MRRAHSQLLTVIGAIVIAGIVAYLLAPSRGPMAEQARAHEKKLQELELDEQYRPCLGFSPSFAAETYRSAEWIEDAEAGRSETKHVLGAAVDDLRAYIERRRTYLDTCKAAMAAGQWNPETRARALREYAERRRTADEAWKKARRPAG